MTACRYECTSGDCRHYCRGFHPGVYEVSVSKSSMKKILAALKRPRELGGTMDINLENGTLDTSPFVAWGGANSVELPHGIFEFHTHPNSCELGKACSMEMPSADDMSIVIHDRMNGNISHMVFTRGCTYALSVSDALHQRLKSLDTTRRGDLCKKILSQFQRFQKRFDIAYEQNKSVVYRMRPGWLRLARKHGFVVKTYPVGVPPTFKIKIY